MLLNEGRAGFIAQTNVSRETLERLDIYLALLEKWNRRINLVGRKTIADAWQRHFLDSAQLAGHISPSVKTIVDLGSGAGFPGLVLAIMGAGWNVHLVDSDQRKCVFLREVARQTDTVIEVHPNRIDQLPKVEPDLITARALAPVGDLLQLSRNIVTPNTEFLFLKGRDVDVELTQAAKCWIMEHQKTQSIADSQGCILAIKNAEMIA
jgi:16S rRNA (guanine527-N7)-methyltransferase